MKTEYETVISTRNEQKICEMITQKYIHIAGLRFVEKDDISWTELETARLLVFNSIRRDDFKTTWEQFVARVRDVFYHREH